MHSSTQPPRPNFAQASLNSVAKDGEWVLYIPFFIAYTVFAIYFYFSVIEPYLAAADLYATRILADTITYEAICAPGRFYLDRTTFRDIGPCVALQLTSYSSGWLSVVNGALIVLSSLWLAKAFDRNWKPVLALILLNPITFLSIFGANKEVFGLVTFITLAIFIRNRSPWALAICVIAATFTRIPLLVIVAPYCITLVTFLPRGRMVSRPTARRYALLLVAMMFAASIVVALIGKDLQYNMLGDLSLSEMDNRAFYISLYFEFLSDYGLFIINFLIRLFLNIYSGILGVWVLFSSGRADYYSVGVGFSSLQFIILTLMALKARRRTQDEAGILVWNFVIFVAVFTMSLCISPVIQHRYFYPLFVFLILCVTKSGRAQSAPSFPSAYGEANAPPPGPRRGARP